MQKFEQETVGAFIDIDGVVLQGGKPFDWSVEAIHALWDNDIPFVFVTNGTYCSDILVTQLTEILGLPFTNDHIVVAPSPCSELTNYHDKHVLLCCQDDSIDLAKELGFSSCITIDELVEVFPELDYVDHKKRKWLLANPMTAERQKAQNDFKPIEAILLLGEPINWECSLQIILDVIMTNGDPRTKFKVIPSPHLPLIAANKDLTFKGAATLPRFGHGAFLECLEKIFEKITRNELVYEHLMGKPYLCTYEYATSKLQRLTKKGTRIKTLYIIGDNPDVDIRGANIYKEHLDRLESKSSRRGSLLLDISEQQQLQDTDTTFSLSSDTSSLKINLNQRASTHPKVESMLVSTGVYNPANDLLVQLRSLESLRIAENNNNNATADENNVVNVNSEKITINVSGDNDTSEALSGVQLRKALSRKNSFISYFDNKLNIPDVYSNNLLDAVHLIIQNKNNS